MLFLSGINLGELQASVGISTPSQTSSCAQRFQNTPIKRPSTDDIGTNMRRVGPFSTHQTQPSPHTSQLRCDDRQLSVTICLCASAQVLGEMPISILIAMWLAWHHFKDGATVCSLDAFYPAPAKLNRMDVE